MLCSHRTIAKSTRTTSRRAAACQSTQILVPCGARRGVTGGLRTDRHIHADKKSRTFHTAAKKVSTRFDWKMTGSPTISLDAKEEKLASLLVDCAEWINATQPQPADEDGGTSVDYSRGAVEVRIAGGWVRDKLLGLPSHDLDISLSVMTGLNFAILFKAFLLRISPQTSKSADIADAAVAAMSRITKIAANPKQSKNLETATANILGLDLDFVNLRKEVYEGDSRIPLMSFGTPREDAERRDITINSLFFNVKTRQVEDWTGKGVEDLKSGIVRTPLPPLTTFLDDPLRILRSVRFASRFSYHLDQSIVACLTGMPLVPEAAAVDHDQDPRLIGTADPVELAKEGQALLRQALMTKVSRERVGIEVEKMMAGPFPLLAHLHLHNLGLYCLVFHPNSLTQEGLTLATRARDWPVEPASTADVRDMSKVAIAASLWLDTLSQRPVSHQPAVTQALGQAGFGAPEPARGATLRSRTPRHILEVLDNGEQRRRLEFSCAFLAIGAQDVEEKKGKWLWVGDKVMMQGLKVRTACLRLHQGLLGLTLPRKFPSQLGKNHTSLPVTSMMNAVKLFAGTNQLASAIRDRCYHYIPQLPELGEPLSLKASLGLLLRDRNVFNAAIEVSPPACIALSLLVDLVFARPGTPAEHIIDRYIKLLDTIDEFRLLHRLDEKPILDGNAVLSLLELKPGPMTPRIQNAVLIWQLEALQGSVVELSDAERAVQEERVKSWLVGMWLKGMIVPVSERIAPSSGSYNKAGTTNVKKQAQQQQRPAGSSAEREKKRQKSEEANSQ